MARRVFDTEAKVLYKVEKREDHISTVSTHCETNRQFSCVQNFLTQINERGILCQNQKMLESVLQQK